MTPSGDRLLWTIFDWFIRQIPADWELSCQYRAESSLKNISDHPTLSKPLHGARDVWAATGRRERRVGVDTILICRAHGLTSRLLKSGQLFWNLETTI